MPSEEFMFTRVEEAVVITVITVMIALAVIGNTALLCAIYFTPKLKTTSNFFIASLAFSNLITGVYTMPLGLVALAHKGEWIFGDTMCDIGGFIDNLTICAAMVTLGTTRYLLVCHAIKYPDIMSKRACAVSIAFIWVWSITISFPPLVGWSSYTFSEASYTCASSLGSSYFVFYVSTTFPLPILVIFPSYYCIFRGSLGKVVGAGTVRRQKNNLRTAKIILLIIIIFAVCVFPVFIIGILLMVNVQIPKSNSLAFSVIWLLLANSSINPIVYGLLNTNFRRVYVTWFKKLFGITTLSGVLSSNSQLDPQNTVLSRGDVELTNKTKDQDTTTTSLSH